MEYISKNWKRYSLNELGFKCFHGVRQKVSDRIEGDTPLLTAGKINQGVAAFISNPKCEYKDPITIDMFGNCFFHKGIYSGDDNIYFFINDKLSLSLKLFIASSLSSELLQRFSYIEQFRQDDADKVSVLLPSINKKPDWKYMEKYINNKILQQEKRINLVLKYNSKKKNEISVNKWKEYTISELFDIHPTRAYKLTNPILLDGGNNPVVVNSAYNNGIGGYSSQKTTEKKNTITFSDTVDANTIFFHNEDFIGYPHVQGLYPIGEYKDKWDKYSLLFFCSVFRAAALSKSFDYGNKFRRDIAIKLQIKLPVDKNNDINFRYMSKYIKAVEDKMQKKLNCILK